MKHPQHGLCSTRRNVPTDNNAPAPRVVRLHKHFVPIIGNDDERDKIDNVADQTANVNVIHDNNISNSNLLCFAAFADKRTRTMYINLTGLFPYLSLEGNVCFLIVYHYKTNAILALSISGFSNETIFATYKQQYELLESKGFKIRLNIMDSQASQIINKYLTPKQCKQMLVEPHNHRVNARSRHNSSVPLQQRTASSDYNCGIALPPRLRIL
jgi:hypothetical protein